MQIQQIRNATLLITYSEKLIITDPYLAEKHTMPSYTGASPNPLVDLPFAPQDVIAGVEIMIEAKGFRNVMPVVDTINWEGITILRTPAQHGTGDVLNEMGNTSGFLLQSKNEPTVYWVGDSIWCEAVAAVIDKHQPDIIITHSCGAVWGDNVLIVMDAVQTIDVCRAVPKAVVVATHMESLDHATISRSDLRTLAEMENIKPHQLFIPDDGEILNF